MAALSLSTIESRIKALANRDDYDRSFLHELLLIFGKPKSTVQRLQSKSIGTKSTLADPEHEVALKRVVYFREVQHEEELLPDLESLRTAAHVQTYRPRFIMVTDYHKLVAWDTKTSENLIIDLKEIDQHFTFFLPWAGMEKALYTSEAHADVRAAEKMGKLFDELLQANPGLTNGDNRHALNVFFTRLLFCFFAEDTGVFEEGLFTKTIASSTLKDGSDTQQFLADVFDALDTQDTESKKPYLRHFPYVNGRLFTRDSRFTVPQFTKDARQHLIELGQLMWQEINPDIFGSMFQAVVDPSQRSDLGQHYTSVPNILKTIEPLFLDELKDEFDEGYNSPRKLEKLLDRISKIKVADFACGSGNFLVIAYKELRKLEHIILERLTALDPKYSTLFTYSRINIENFYGVEIDDFAVEVAILSMWIAKHQMNIEFHDKFGVEIPLIPLKEHGNIIAGNACRMEWNDVCPNNGDEEIYLIGNPPYLGSANQTAEQKDDYSFVFAEEKKIPKKLDYIGLWFVKGARYIRGTKASLAFISTNSVVQGEQVAMLAPYISGGLEIGFAYTSFKWSNNAKHNAGVVVVVIGLRNECCKSKYLYAGNLRHQVDNINCYLIEGQDVVVEGRSKPLSLLPSLTKGSQPTDSNQLILTRSEKEQLIHDNPAARKWIRGFLGSEEFIKSAERYCLWISDDDYANAETVPSLKKRFEVVAVTRKKSVKVATRKLADVPYKFAEIRYKESPAILIPSVSSNRRDYVPIGFVGSDVVISNLAFAAYDAEPWLFAVLTSKIHMVWLATVGGRMGNGYRYSNKLVYNTFPIPKLTDEDKERLTHAAFRVLDVREYHCGATLADLYDPDKMPENLRQAHREIDVLVDEIFAGKPLESDEERRSLLFKMYSAAILKEEREETQKTVAKRTRKAKK